MNLFDIFNMIKTQPATKAQVDFDTRNIRQIFDEVDSYEDAEDYFRNAVSRALARRTDKDEDLLTLA